VLIDDKPILSCLTLAVDCEDARITTIEGWLKEKSDGRAAVLPGERGCSVRLLHVRDGVDGDGPSKGTLNFRAGKESPGRHIVVARGTQNRGAIDAAIGRRGFNACWGTFAKVSPVP